MTIQTDRMFVTPDIFYSEPTVASMEAAARRHGYKFTAQDSDANYKPTLHALRNYGTDHDKRDIIFNLGTPQRIKDHTGCFHYVSECDANGWVSSDFFRADVIGDMFLSALFADYNAVANIPELFIMWGRRRRLNHSKSEMYPESWLTLYDKLVHCKEDVGDGTLVTSKDARRLWNIMSWNTGRFWKHDDHKLNALSPKDALFVLTCRESYRENAVTFSRDFAGRVNGGLLWQDKDFDPYRICSAGIGMTDIFEPADNMYAPKRLDELERKSNYALRLWKDHSDWSTIDKIKMYSEYEGACLEGKPIVTANECSGIRNIALESQFYAISKLSGVKTYMEALDDGVPPEDVFA